MTPTFAPMKLFQVHALPRGGRKQMLQYAQSVAAERKDLMYLVGASMALVVMAFLPFVPTFVGVLFGGVSVATGVVAGKKILSLSRRQVYQELPEGATLETALLEDALTKETREWNDDAREWNLRAKDWNASVAHWKRVRVEPSEDDFEWTPEALEDRRESLSNQEHILGFEHNELVCRRQAIQAKLTDLESKIRHPVSDD